MHLADEFYLIAHQDSTGQPRLHSRAAGYGLAAALLAELHLLGNLTIGRSPTGARNLATGGNASSLPSDSRARLQSMDEHNVTVTSSSPPQDPLAHSVLEHLLGEPFKRPVRDWLAFLGRTAVQDVARRLTRLGVLELVLTRRLWGVHQAYVPVEDAINEAAWPHARLTAHIVRRQQVDLPDQILTGLCVATGLTRKMLWGEEQQSARHYLGQVIGDLPPPLRTLVTETEIAISKSAATRG